MSRSSLSPSRISIEPRYLWSIVFAVLFHLLILAIFSFAMPWQRTSEIPDAKISGHRAFVLNLVSDNRNSSIDVKKSASAETIVAATDAAVQTVQKERGTTTQAPSEASEADKGNTVSADANIVQEKNDMRSDDKKNPGRDASARPLRNNVDEDWMHLIKAQIVANSAYTPSALDGEVNAVIEFDVTLQPDGSVLAVEELKQSGNSKFDGAILQAVKELQLNLSNASAKVPSHFTLAIHMVDLLSGRSPVVDDD